MALAVCCLSLYDCTAAFPVGWPFVISLPLLLLTGISQDTRFSITEEAAAGTGLCALLVAVALFLSCGEKEYAFLEKEPLEVPPERSWVIWTVAGVLFGAVMTVMRLLNRKK